MPGARRLLILDDDPLIGRTIQNIAEFARYSVRVTRSPGEFFAILSDWTPDLIALDLIMPEMDGVEVMAELAQRQCRSRIIITSGVDNRILDAAGRSAAEHGLNIAGVLAKPFMASSLRNLLAEVEFDAPRQTEGLAEAHPAKARALTAADLRRALERAEIFVVYQPKVLCINGDLAGFEALARWRHPRLGVITPDVFIPLAESSGLIDTLTMQVVTASLHWFSDFCTSAGKRSQLRAKDRNQLTLSLNISARSLSNTDLFERLDALCRRAGIDPQRIIFELTETSAMGDPVGSLGLLTRLRMRGFRLSIDDFGTGFSSMLQLVRLPFSEIKVDKSFVATAHRSAESRAVIRSIADLGRSLGLQVTAEGIEDEETLLYLRRVGCDQVQGFLLARPMEGSAVLDWLRKRQAQHRQRQLRSPQALIGTPPDARFDAVVALARRLFGVPMAAFGLVDGERVWFKARQGIEPAHVLRQTSFCSHTLEGKGAFVVPDAQVDARFSVRPALPQQDRVRFYAGHRVSLGEGPALGCLCVLDHKPRSFSNREEAALAELARWLEGELADPASADAEGVFAASAFALRARRALSLCVSLGLPATLLRCDLRAAGEGAQSVGPPHRQRALLRLLAACLSAGDLIGRVAENRYCVFLARTGPHEGEALMRRLRAALSRHNACSLKGLELEVDLEARSARPTGGGGDLQALLEAAEESLCA